MTYLNQYMNTITTFFDDRKNTPSRTPTAFILSLPREGRGL